MLIECPSCERQISSNANPCPYCGETKIGELLIEKRRRHDEYAREYARDAPARAAAEAKKRSADKLTAGLLGGLNFGALLGVPIGLVVGLFFGTGSFFGTVFIFAVIGFSLHWLIGEF